MQLLTEEDERILAIVDSLKGKQKEYFWMLIDGKSEKEITFLTSSSVASVYKRINIIKKKLNVSKSAQIISKTLPAIIRRDCEGEFEKLVFSQGGFEYSQLEPAMKLKFLYDLINQNGGKNEN